MTAQISKIQKHRRRRTTDGAHYNIPRPSFSPFSFTISSISPLHLSPDSISFNSPGFWTHSRFDPTQCRVHFPIRLNFRFSLLPFPRLILYPLVFLFQENLKTMREPGFLNLNPLKMRDAELGLNLLGRGPSLLLLNLATR